MMDKPAATLGSRKRLLVGAAALVLLTAAAYLPALRGGFIWDDDVYLISNRLLTAPGGLGKIWFSLESPSQYFPLTYTTFRLERSLWGLDPFGYHLVNLILHAANALLLWLVLYRLSLPGAWPAAALFALHPVQVESVAWITERKTLLSALFSLMTALAWLAFIRRKSGSGRLLYVLAMVLCALALFSKTTAATLPVSLLVLCWLEEGKVGARRLGQAVPFALMGAAMGFISFWWEVNHQGTRGPEFAFSLAQRVLIAGRSLWFHLSKVIWPSGLAFSYLRWEIDPGNPAAWAWPASVLLAAVVLWRWRRAMGKGPAAAAIHYASSLGPMLGFVSLYSFQYTFAADHYQYMALIGPAALAAAAAAGLGGASPAAGRSRRMLAAAVLAVLGVLTWRQTHVYRDPETLWRDTLAKNPASWMARANLGKLLAEKGRLEEALARYDEALALKPKVVQALYGKGYVLERMGRPREALPYLLETLAMLPGSWDAHNTIGIALAALGRLDEAEAHLRASIALKPDSPQGHFNLGTVMIQRGKVRQAVSSYERAVGLDSGNPEYRVALGETYARLGRFEEATVQFNEALRIKPGYQRARDSLTVLLRSLEAPPPTPSNGEGEKGRAGVKLR